MHKVIRGIATLAVAVLALAALGPSAHAAGPLTEIAALSVGQIAHDVAIQGNYAYVTHRKGLAIVDISNPAQPVKRGELLTLGVCLGITVQGNYAYVASNSKDLAIVDISNPDKPVLVSNRTHGGSAWDVAVKGTTAYSASYAGEIYVFDVSNPAKPTQVRILGVVAWNSPGQDAASLTKMRNLVTGGNAKVTGISIDGNTLLAVDWNYGHVYAWDISNPTAPVFKGAHYAPFTFRVEGDLARGWVYSIAAYGSSSGVLSMPASVFDPFVGSHHSTCTPCDFFPSVTGDYAGIAVSPNGRYVVYIAGKAGVIEVVDVSNPSNMVSAGKINLGKFNVKTGQSLGVAISGDHIFAAAGNLGLRVFRFPGLSN